jgi:hypothetical protein
VVIELALHLARITSLSVTGKRSLAFGDKNAWLGLRGLEPADVISRCLLQLIGERSQVHNIR